MRYLLAHHPRAGLLPVLLVGVLVVVDAPLPEWLPDVAGAATVVLVAAGLISEAAHRRLDRAGVPCEHCEMWAEVED